MGNQKAKEETTIERQMTEAEKAEDMEVYDQIPDTYKEWEEQREDIRMEYAKQYQRNNGYTLSLFTGAIMFFNAFQQMRKIRVIGMEEAGTGTIILMIVSLIIAIGLFLYASHLRKLRYKEYTEMMQKKESEENEKK